MRHSFSMHKEAKCTNRRQISSAFLHCGHWVPLFLVDATLSRRSGCADNLSAWVLRHRFRHKEAKCTNRRQISSAFLHCGHWVPLFLVDATLSRRSGCADNRRQISPLGSCDRLPLPSHRFRQETKCTKRRQISSAFLHCGHWVPLFPCRTLSRRSHKEAKCTNDDKSPRLSCIAVIGFCRRRSGVRSGCADNLSAWVLRHHFRHKETKCTKRRQISSAFLGFCHCGHWVPLFLVDATLSRRSGCADNLSAWVLRHHFRHKETKCTNRRQISSAFLHCGHWVPLFLVDATLSRRSGCADNLSAWVLRHRFLEIAGNSVGLFGRFVLQERAQHPQENSSMSVLVRFIRRVQSRPQRDILM